MARYGMFQSLFYWKLFSNYIAILLPIHPIPVSILILLEALLQSATWKKGSRHITKVSILILLEALLQLGPGDNSLGLFYLFQSLFYWKLFSNAQASSPPHCEEIVSILILLEALLQYQGLKTRYKDFIWFQSLFYWKLFSNKKKNGKQV